MTKNRNKPREYTITLSTSSRFIHKLPGIKKRIENVEEGSLGPVRFNVLTPKIKRYRKQNDINIHELQYLFFKQQYSNIDKSDALYIFNPVTDLKNGGYLGGNSLLLMGKAFEKGIPILLNHICHNQDFKNYYTEEIDLMLPLVMGTNFKSLDYLLSTEYQIERKNYFASSNPDNHNESIHCLNDKLHI